MHLSLNKIHTINCIAGLKLVASKSVQSCVSSPPYYALRDYGLEDTEWPAITYTLFGLTIKVKAMKCCLGLEPTPNDFIGHLIYSSGRPVHHFFSYRLQHNCHLYLPISYHHPAVFRALIYIYKLNGGLSSQIACKDQPAKIFPSIKPKDMLGIPWMLAFALREDGWFLRQDIIWHKKNCMPESCKDRCTKNHEYIFLLSKSKKYYFDQLAIAVPIAASTANDSRLMNEDYTTATPDRGYPGHATQGNGMLKPKYKVPNGWDTSRGNHNVIDWNTENNLNRGKKISEQISMVGIEIKGSESFAPWKHNSDARLIRASQNDKLIPGLNTVQHRPDRPDTVPTALANRRSVWSIATQGFKEAHFATFPDRLPELCIKAGTSEHGSCAKCGAPYRRLTEKELKPGPKASYNSKPDERDFNSDAHDAGSNRMKDGHKPGWHNETTTIGWTRTCRCQTDEIKPCVVMDMFSGAGTVPMVSVLLGRDFMAMEQSSKYVKMSERRMHKRLGLFNPANKEMEAMAV